MCKRSLSQRKFGRRVTCDFSKQEECVDRHLQYLLVSSNVTYDLFEIALCADMYVCDQTKQHTHIQSCEFQVSPNGHITYSNQ